MTRRPTEVKVGYKTYEIQPYSPQEMRDNSHTWGRTQHDKALIRFDDTIERRELANTILHETFHAIRHTTHKVIDNEEEVVIAMTDGLCQVMRDNPKLFLWLLEELK